MQVPSFFSPFLSLFAFIIIFFVGGWGRIDIFPLTCTAEEEFVTDQVQSLVCLAHAAGSKYHGENPRFDSTTSKRMRI